MDQIDGKTLLIIAGVGKAGTTSLFSYLAQHPDICSSDVKEVNYFSTVRYPGPNIPPFESYLQHYSSCREKPIFLEASPGYFPGGEATARRIYQHHPEARFIIIFREPVKRLFSFYNYYKSRVQLRRGMNFDEYVQECLKIPEEEIFLPENRVFRGVYESFYSKFLPGWHQVFPNEQIKILFFEQLFTQIKPSLADICEWIQVPSQSYLQTVKLTRENKSMLYRSKFLQRVSISVNKLAEVFWRKYPNLKDKLRSIYFILNGKPSEEKISAEMEQRLRYMFAPYNKELKVQLQALGYSDLPEWLK